MKHFILNILKIGYVDMIRIFVLQFFFKKAFWQKQHDFTKNVDFNKTVSSDIKQFHQHVSG